MKDLQKMIKPFLFTTVAVLAALAVDRMIEKKRAMKGTKATA